MQHFFRTQPKKICIDYSLLDLVIEQIDKALLVWDMKGRVSLTGGEPFLNIDALFYILNKLEYVQTVNHIGILSNGTLLDQDLVKRIREKSKVKEVQISLDGSESKVHDMTRGVGSFSKAISGIKLLIDYGIPTAIMFTATKANIHEAVAVIDLAEKLGVNAITIERYTPFHHQDDLLALTSIDTEKLFRTIVIKKEELLAKKSKLKIRTSRPLWNLISKNYGGVCPVGFSCLTIMHDGQVYPCRRLPIPLGRIQKDGIFKIWYTSSILNKLRQREKIEKCSSCENNSICGGCRAAAYANNGDYMSSDPLCWRKK